ncbi:hypothetical protein H6503_04950 [Candidatus Woesearchaeota archaeon]|nr:hypothetical protein [Candidatus Woesearchaeota archaeon]
MNLDIVFLKEEWNDFCRRNDVKGFPDYYFRKLQEQYSKHDRFYHTFDGHIANVIREFKSARHLCKDPDFVFFELMNHDSVYGKLSYDEELSANYAYYLADKMGLPLRFKAKNGEVILATRHKEIPNGIDASVAVDCDLASLGKPYNEFMADSEDVRKEFSWVEEDKFREVRADILEKFLRRSSVYITDMFKSRYERQARYNLRRAITELRA